MGHATGGGCRRGRWLLQIEIAGIADRIVQSMRGRLLLDEQIENRVVQTIERFLVRIEAGDTYGFFVTAFDLSLTCASSCRARGVMTALSSPSSSA